MKFQKKMLEEIILASKSLVRKKIFKKNKWPTIDVTRKSVEETAASIVKIYEIKNKNA